jgi:hypothetical protein
VHKSHASMKSDDEGGPQQNKQEKAFRIAKYKGDIVIVKFLKIPNFQIKNSTIRELRKVNRFFYFIYFF